MLLTPEGGKLTQTPASKAEDNLMIEKAWVQIEEEGNAKAKISTIYTGNQHSKIRSLAEIASSREQKDWLMKTIDIGSFDIEDFSFEEGKTSTHPSYQLDLNLAIKHCANVQGERLFLSPNLLNKYSFIPPRMPERSQPIQINTHYMDLDTIEYQLPEGYVVEAIGTMPILVETEFGKYEANVQIEPNGKVIYTRKVQMNKLEIPAESYEAYRKFKKKIVKADKMQVVFSRKS